MTMLTSEGAAQDYQSGKSSVLETAPVSWSLLSVPILTSYTEMETTQSSSWGFVRRTESWNGSCNNARRTLFVLMQCGEYTVDSTQSVTKDLKLFWFPNFCKEKEKEEIDDAN